MRKLPVGTVTFLFTDIEGSTRLLRDLGARYADVLAEHRRVLREAFGRHAGVEVDTQGDAFFVAFQRATDAVAAAVAGQRELADGPVRVRMGVHTGEPLVTGEGYVGVDVHRAARVMSAGHGVQVLVSERAGRLWGAVEGELERGPIRMFTIWLCTELRTGWVDAHAGEPFERGRAAGRDEPFAEAVAAALASVD